MTVDYYTDNPWLWVATVIVGTIGVARAVRILVHEDFPPTKWLRNTWIKLVRGEPWSSVVTCHWCNAPYLVAGSMLWFVLGLFWWEPLLWAWWIIHLWAAVSYAASWIVHHDEDGHSQDPS